MLIVMQTMVFIVVLIMFVIVQSITGKLILRVKHDFDFNCYLFIFSVILTTVGQTIPSSNNCFLTPSKTILAIKSHNTGFYLASLLIGSQTQTLFRFGLTTQWSVELITGTQYYGIRNMFTSEYLTAVTAPIFNICISLTSTANTVNTKSRWAILSAGEGYIALKNQYTNCILTSQLLLGVGVTPSSAIGTAVQQWSFI